MTIVPRRSHAHLDVSHVACLGQLRAVSVARPCLLKTVAPIRQAARVELHRLKRKLNRPQLLSRHSVEIGLNV
jgi:hypothetical protein